MVQLYPTEPGTPESRCAAVLAIKDRFFNELVRIADELDHAENRLYACEQRVRNAKPDTGPDYRTLALLQVEARRAGVEFWRYFHGFQEMIDDMSVDEKIILRHTRWAQQEFRKYGIQIDGRNV